MGVDMIESPISHLTRLRWNYSISRSSFAMTQPCYDTQQAENDDFGKE